MLHDVPAYGNKSASDLERSDSATKEAKYDGDGVLIEELGAGAASKGSGLLGKVMNSDLCSVTCGGGCLCARCGTS
jgi:hypothetical protein